MRASRTHTLMCVAFCVPFKANVHRLESDTLGRKCAPYYQLSAYYFPLVFDIKPDKYAVAAFELQLSGIVGKHDIFNTIIPIGNH